MGYWRGLVGSFQDEIGRTVDSVSTTERGCPKIRRVSVRAALRECEVLKANH